MFDIKIITFMCLMFYISTANAGVVSFIDPCHWNDSNCLLKSAKKALPYVVSGIPELGTDTLNPLSLKKVNGDNGDLKLSFENLIVERLPQCNLIKVERKEKLKVYIEVECPIRVTGQYNLSGKLFVVPVDGHGDCEIYTEKIKITSNILLKEFKKDGKGYYRFANYDYKYEPQEKVYIKFHNLYDGNVEKAAPINKILDESWRDLINEVGKPVIKQIIISAITTVGKVFHTIPIDEIELV